MGAFGLPVGASTAERQRGVTIVDVAREAGVSVGTVSRFLNGHLLRSNNREAVESAIDKLGYRHNAVAASLKTNTTLTVGILLPALGPHHAQLLDHLTRKMRQRGRAVVCFCHDKEPQTFIQGLEFFIDHRVDAVIMDGVENLKDKLQPYIDNGLIAVLYDNDHPGLLADRVFVENRKISRTLTEHLLQLGHRRIGILNGKLTQSAGRERLQGYLDAMEAAGLPNDEMLTASGFWDVEGGYSATRELMESVTPPTAIVSANSDMTVGALRWFRENNVSIPGDMSLVSFDDLQAFSVREIGITAAPQPLESLAETITTVLLERLDGSGPFARRTFQLNADIIWRGSTRPL